MPTYAPGLVFVKGKGAKVWDADGKEYLDFLAGIAVLNVGHCHPKVVKAIKTQAAKLMHVSNLYYNENQPRLAQTLSTLSLNGKCFFCNSGAEANEGLIKLARLWGHAQGKYEVISMTNSFHGRTLATMTATGQTKYQKGFEPLPAGFVYAEYNNLESVRAAINEKTAAILVEAVQGEGGIVPAQPEFMMGLRALCDEKNSCSSATKCSAASAGPATGSASRRTASSPTRSRSPRASPTDSRSARSSPRRSSRTSSSRATTPARSAATRWPAPRPWPRSTSSNRKSCSKTRRQMGDLFRQKLKKLAKKYSFIKDVRGIGLMVGLVCDRPVKPLEVILREKGLISIATHDTVIRFLPPLNVKASQIRQAVKIVDEACAQWQATCGAVV